jgi:hypothetical protein
MEKIPQKPKQKQKPKVLTLEEQIKEKIEQTRGEIGKSESQPKTQQTATQGQQQKQLTPNEQKLAALKERFLQKTQSTPTTQPPSASL